MQHLNDVKGKTIVPGLYGRFVHGENVTLSFVDIEPGAQLPEHSHPHEQIPGNTPHGAHARTACKVLDVFSPVREDYRV